MAHELQPKPDWLEELFPWEQHAVNVNGRTMAYIDEGDPAGRPILLLSGNPTWGFLYRFFVPPLTEAGYRVIAPDWIGAGYSDKPRIDAAYSTAHHIADLVSLIDQLDLEGFVIVGQDWGGAQGVHAGLCRKSRMAAMVLMNTGFLTDLVGKFHGSPKPWTTWNAPLIGQFFMKWKKVLSHGGPSLTTKRGMTEKEARGYHHIYDEPDSDHVVLTWPRSIPMREGDRGWADMKALNRRLPELGDVPTLLLWAPGDNVFTIEYAEELKTLLPHAEGPIVFDEAAHFLQDDRGPDLSNSIVEFLDRTVGRAL
ncbi:MAG: alpha/beta fold hydrolase [Desulfobacterales bacterium]